ncbi:uncharacterized protein LOC134812675 isoform X2 [Bolinopsis microptera]|uniref:uncharacterized protein LOC134812675 isoform X2 n=1 Tax=Bolinopsis microptera TaxID=2820187 RepID=UPI003078EDD5
MMTMITAVSQMEDIFIVPPPPGSMTVLLTEDYLASFITPPPPAEFLSEKKSCNSTFQSDVDSDYHSVGGDSPVTPDLIKKYNNQYNRTSPLGSSPTTHEESYIRTTLPSEEITARSRTGSAPSIHRPVETTSIHRPVETTSKSDELSEGLIDKISARHDLRQNKMYSSLTRPSTARARQMRDRRGSYDDFSKMDVGPGSPRDSASVLGNLEMENSFGRGGDRGERRQYRQAVNPEVHGAIDHFIRSEQRYISDINSLLNLHIEPLQYQGCLNIDVVNSLKSSLLRLLHFHQRSCGDFEMFFTKTISEAQDGKAPDYFTLINYMCDTLMESRGGFKTYINFCCTRASLLRNIGQMNEDDAVRWEKYLEQCNPSGDPAHSLDAGLMMPIQRIADYPAMCREIQIRGHVRTGVLYEKIGRSSAMLEGVAKAVDEKLSMQKEFSCLYRNNRKLEVLIGPIEELLHYGSVVEVKTRDIENFVPESDTGLLLLVYKKGAALVQRIKIKKKHSFNLLAEKTAQAPKEEYQLKKFYPVSCLQLRDLPHNHVFEITDTVAQQRVVLASRLIEAKAELIKNVADIIMDYDKFLSSSLQMKDSV